MTASLLIQMYRFIHIFFTMMTQVKSFYINATPIREQLNI